MPEETKLLCNNCFQPLELNVYDIGIFINPCSCRIESLEKEWDDIVQNEAIDGYYRGYDEGHDRGYEEGLNNDSYSTKKIIDGLKKKLEKYNGLIEDDEYLDRLGA